MFDRDTFVLLCQTLCVLGALGTARQLHIWRCSKRAMSWRTTPGVITSVRMKKGWYQPNVGRGDLRLRVYSIQLSYSYSVDGQDYIGTRAQFGSPRRETAQARAKERLARYSVTQPVSVHYDARKPADAVLDPRLDLAWQGSALLAAVLLFVGMCGWAGAAFS